MCDIGSPSVKIKSPESINFILPTLSTTQPPSSLSFLKNGFIFFTHSYCFLCCFRGNAVLLLFFDYWMEIS